MTEETVKKYNEIFNSALLNENKSIKWNPIENTSRSFIEFKDYSYGTDIYLEKDDVLNVVLWDAHIPDMIEKYGSDHWYYEMLSKNMLYKADSSEELDAFICRKYMKTTEEVSELLNAPIESLKDSFEELVWSDIDVVGILKKSNIFSVGDLLEKEPANLEKIAEFSKRDVVNIIDAVHEVYKGWERKYFSAYYEEAENKYFELFKRFTADGVIDPLERMQLEKLRKELGLFYRSIANSEDSYIKKNFNGKNKLKTYRSFYDSDAEKLGDLFTDSSVALSIAREFTEENKPVPALRPVTTEIAAALIKTLKTENYTICIDNQHVECLLVDFEHNKIAEQHSFADAIKTAIKITESWDNDNLTDEEYKCYEAIHRITDTNDIIIPFDVSTYFKIPEKIIEDTVEDTIRNCEETIFETYAFEAGFLDTSYGLCNNGDAQVYFKYRLYMPCKMRANYKNADYKELAAWLTKDNSSILNEHFCLNNEIRFYNTVTSIPVEFLTEAGHKVSVDEENMKRFLMTEEEYAESLDAEELKKQGKSFEEEIKSFAEEKKDFMEVLKREPSLAVFVKECQQDFKCLKNMASTTLLCCDANELDDAERIELEKNIRKSEEYILSINENDLKIDKVFFLRHDSVETARKDNHEVVLAFLLDRFYRVYDVVRDNENKIVSFDEVPSLVDKKDTINRVCNVLVGSNNIDFSKQLDKGFSIRSLDDKDLTRDLLEISDEKELSFDESMDFIQEFIDKSIEYLPKVKNNPMAAMSLAINEWKDDKEKKAAVNEYLKKLVEDSKDSFIAFANKLFGSDDASPST